MKVAGGCNQREAALGAEEGIEGNLGAALEKDKVSDGYIMPWTSSSLLPSVPDPDMEPDLYFLGYQVLFGHQAVTSRSDTQGRRKHDILQNATA